MCTSQATCTQYDMASGSELETVGHRARQLTKEETEKLKNDTQVVSDFKRGKLEQEAKKNWDLFYKRNSTHFFKDRHWITREFPELLETISELGSDRTTTSEVLSEQREKRRLILLEAGCGVGNTIFPLLEENPNLFIHACDFSPRAIDFVKAHTLYSVDRCNAFVCDLTVDKLSDVIPNKDVDLASLFFVLSAISPEKMSMALKNIHSILKPGGVLLFRDYGLYDHAQLRFGRGHKIADNFYMRQDGTRAYYFSEERLAELQKGAGFEVIENNYVQKETVNLKEGVAAPRVFVQGRFIKPYSQIP